MNINCSTCLELISPSDDLSSIPCGHVFHTNCLLQWFETGKSNCPQCRTKCRENQLRRIYFTEGLDTTASQSDPNALQNRIDSLTFQLRCTDTEKKNFKEQVDELTAKNLAIRDEVKSLKNKNRKAQDEASNLLDQVKILKGERDKAREAKKKAKELEEKLETYKSIDIAINGTLPQMLERLQGLQSNEEARQCSLIAEQLKKQLESKSLENSKLIKGLRSKMNECTDLKSKLDESNAKRNVLTITNNQLKSDLEHTEEENEALKKKLELLQAAITSPSGDPKSSALVRLVSEHPTPLKLNMTITNSPPTPKAATKANSLIGLKKDRSPTFKRSASTTESLFSKKPKLSTPLSQPSQSTSSRSMFYDGFGGHSKKEEEPSVFLPRMKPLGATKNRKPLKTNNATSDRKLNTLNKYFNFDTP